jgi:hypothetical protein
MFEQVRTLVAGDDDRPERVGLGAGWRGGGGLGRAFRGSCSGTGKFFGVVPRRRSVR